MNPEIQEVAKQLAELTLADETLLKDYLEEGDKSSEARTSHRYYLAVQVLGRPDPYVEASVHLVRLGRELRYKGINAYRAKLAYNRAVLVVTGSVGKEAGEPVSWYKDDELIASHPSDYVSDSLFVE